MANKEISELKQILGLQQNKDYSDPNAVKTLRYGRLMLMTDQVRYHEISRRCHTDHTN